VISSDPNILNFMQACFAVGMFALQSTHEKDAKRRAHYVELAEQIGNTCHEAYKRTGKNSNLIICKL
jgi:hypothetical protein